MSPSALELLSEAWDWRELDAARCRTLLGQAVVAGLGTLGQPSLERRSAVAAARTVQGYLSFRDADPAGALEAASEALAQLAAGAPGQPVPGLWYSRALNVRSAAQLELGEFEVATLSLREQLRASRLNGDTQSEGAALHDLGVMHTRQDPDHAEGYLLAAAGVFERTGYAVGRSYAAWSLGELREIQGHLEAAYGLYQQALTLAHACGHRFLEVLVLSRLGELALSRGDEATGEALLRAAVQRQHEDPSRPLWVSVPPLVRLLLHRGRTQEARILLEAQLAGGQAAGMISVQASVHELLSEVLGTLDEPVLALHHAREHLRLYKKENAAEQARKVRALEVLHRTELAEQEARALRQRNEELRAALDELNQLHRQLEQVSVTDELTGVHNRRYLMTRGAALLGRTRTDAADDAVAILDIDHFKTVNDTHGHDGGDRVLRAFAQHLNAGLRTQDVLTRFGGEEFVVLFPSTPLGEAYALLDGLRLKLKRHEFAGFPRTFRVSFTAGLVGCPDGDLMGALRRADHLLYRSKQAGRDVVTREPVAG